MLLKTSCILLAVIISSSKSTKSLINLTGINWAHAVNNRAYLEAALASKVAMLEADIVLGRIVGSEDSPLIPIMAHPPANTSDLSLEAFLSAVSEFNKNNQNSKGVKLDFKSIEAFEASQNQIAPFSSPEVKFPLWINADILPGPVDATTTPVDGRQFLKLSSQHQRAVLSIGWTTRYVDDVDQLHYTTEQIENMINILKELNVSQPVTFPVRASIAANSGEILSRLLRDTSALGSTLTVWGSDSDSVDVDKLRNVMLNIGLDKTYLDVSNDLIKALSLPSPYNY